MKTTRCQAKSGCPVSAGFVLLGIHAPDGHVMPHTQNSGQAQSVSRRFCRAELAPLPLLCLAFCRAELAPLPLPPILPHSKPIAVTAPSPARTLLASPVGQLRGLLRSKSTPAAQRHPRNSPAAAKLPNPPHALQKYLSSASPDPKLAIKLQHIVNSPRNRRVSAVRSEAWGRCLASVTAVRGRIRLAPVALGSGTIRVCGAATRLVGVLRAWHRP